MVFAVLSIQSVSQPTAQLYLLYGGRTTSKTNLSSCLPISMKNYNNIRVTHAKFPINQCANIFPSHFVLTCTANYSQSFNQSDSCCPKFVIVYYSIALSLRSSLALRARENFIALSQKVVIFFVFVLKGLGRNGCRDQVLVSKGLILYIKSN